MPWRGRMAWPCQRGRAVRRADPDRDRRSPADRPRPQGRQALPRFRPGWRSPHRSWQAAALARGVPVHLAARRDRRPGHPGLLDRRQSAGRRAARRGARLRCPDRRPAIDEARGLVFLPTTSPSPDFYGGLRPGDNRSADSVVALEIATGKLVWEFQTVHHDVWDYDNPAQPTLATIQVAGAPRDVVIAPTKQGMIFVLDRDTGKPVFPVEERKVPQGGVAGEALSP